MTAMIDIADVAKTFTMHLQGGVASAGACAA